MTGQVQHVEAFKYTGPTTEETPTTQNRSAAIVRVIWCIAGVIAVLLATRFVFMFLGANQNHQFVDIVYTLSTPFATPFFGLFGYTAHYDVSSFEYSTLVAIAAYLLIAWGLMQLTTVRQFRQPNGHHRRHIRSHA